MFFVNLPFFYITLLGPKTFDGNFANTNDYINGGGMNPGNGSSMGLFQAAMHIRRNSRLNVSKTLAIGWPIGMILDNEKGDTQGSAEKGFFLLVSLVCFLLAFLVCFLLVFPVCFLLAFLGLCRQPHCGCEPLFCLIYIKYPSFLKNNRGNIWRVSKKSIPLHSLFGNTPVSNKRKEFFEKIYINREVVQEASAGFGKPLLCSGKKSSAFG